MGDITLDMIKDFYSLKPLSRGNTLTDAKITGRYYGHERSNAYHQEFKLPKKTNPQR